MPAQAEPDLGALRCNPRQKLTLPTMRAVGEGGGLHLAAMDLHRHLADADLAGDPLIYAALHDQAITSRSRVLSVSKRFPRRLERPFFCEPSSIVRKAELDCVKEILIAERGRTSGCRRGR